MGAITDQDGHVAQITPEGALVVTGAGAEPSATALKIQDGAVVGRFALVDVDGNLHVVVENPVDISELATEATLVQVRDFVDTLEAILAAIRDSKSDQRVLFDYDVRTDGNPVYVGRNAQGAALTANTWQIQRFTYDASNRATDIQVLTGIWNDRSTLGWT